MTISLQILRRTLGSSFTTTIERFAKIAFRRPWEINVHNSIFINMMVGQREIYRRGMGCMKTMEVKNGRDYSDCMQYLKSVSMHKTRNYRHKLSRLIWAQPKS